MMAKAMGKAIWCAKASSISNPNKLIKPMINLETTGSPIHPNPRLAKVMPNCVAAK
jgi:hypothetical protein